MFLIIVLAGCIQEQKTLQTKEDNSFVQKISIPKADMEKFELEYTSIGTAGMVTLVFQKDNIAQINKGTGDVLEMKSKPISKEDFESLAKTVQENRFFNLEEEYGEFISNDGPTYVLEATLNGKQKVVSCQLNCPQEIKIITDKVKTFIE